MKITERTRTFYICSETATLLSKLQATSSDTDRESVLYLKCLVYGTKCLPTWQLCQRRTYKGEVWLPARYYQNVSDFVQRCDHRFLQ